ncbi:protein kinase domain-containing protein [Nocardia thailandica]
MFGPYELRTLLGAGGMGEVYEAYDTGKDRIVALKLLSEELAQDPAYQTRFRRESQAAARLAEPHVIPIHDWGVIDGVLFIDMRLVPGTDLRAALQRSGPLSPERAVGIVEQIAAALDAAHANGLVHRDVKPANILVTPADFAYLADFGIAHTEGDSAVTQVGMAVGSYTYMAPERFDVGPVSGRADIYSLACVLHECLTGAAPFSAVSMNVLIRSHLSEAPPRPSLLVPGLPAGLDEVIARGMAKDPGDRYPTAAALAQDARAALGAPAAAYGGATTRMPAPQGWGGHGPAGRPGFDAYGQDPAAPFDGGDRTGAAPFGAPGPGRPGQPAADGLAAARFGAPAPGGPGRAPGDRPIDPAADRGQGPGRTTGGRPLVGGSPRTAGDRPVAGPGRPVNGPERTTGGWPVRPGEPPAGRGALAGVARAGTDDTDEPPAAPAPGTGEFRVVGAVSATGGIETSRSVTGPATGAQPTLIVRPPEPREGAPETAGFHRVNPEGTGEFMMPAVIQPTGPTEIRVSDIHLTPLPPVDAAPEPPVAPPAYTPDQGLPHRRGDEKALPVRPFPDAHLYEDPAGPPTQQYTPPSAATRRYGTGEFAVPAPGPATGEGPATQYMNPVGDAPASPGAPQAAPQHRGPFGGPPRDPVGRPGAPAGAPPRLLGPPPADGPTTRYPDPAAGQGDPFDRDDSGDGPATRYMGPVAAPFPGGDGPATQYLPPVGGDSSATQYLEPVGDDPRGRYPESANGGAPATRRYPAAGEPAGYDDPERAKATQVHPGTGAPAAGYGAPPRGAAYSDYDDPGYGPGEDAAYGARDYREPAYDDGGYEAPGHGGPAYGAAPGYDDPAYAGGYDDPAYGYDEPRRKSLLPVLIGVAAVVVLLLGGGIAWLLLGGSGGEQAASSPDTTAATTPAAATAPPTASRGTSAPATTSAGAPALPAGAQPCDPAGSGGTFGRTATGSSVTSCGFAEAVRSAYAAGGTDQSRGGPRSVVATSPVTGRTYTMTCTPDGKVVTCTGGDNAVVYVY